MRRRVTAVVTGALLFVVVGSLASVALASVAGAQTPPETTPSDPAAPTTSVDPEDPVITQDTPDLGGVTMLWVVGLVGTAAVLGYSWWDNRP